MDVYIRNSGVDLGCGTSAAVIRITSTPDESQVLCEQANPAVLMVCKIAATSQIASVQLMKFSLAFPAACPCNQDVQPCRNETLHLEDDVSMVLRSRQCVYCYVQAHGRAWSQFNLLCARCTAIARPAATAPYSARQPFA